MNSLILSFAIFSAFAFSGCAHHGHHTESGSTEHSCKMGCAQHKEGAEKHCAECGTKVAKAGCPDCKESK